MKKIISIILIVSLLLPIIAGCNSVQNEDEYITNGDFYALFIESTNMYNDDYSLENMYDYASAEYLMYDRYLLDESQCDKYNELLTKEIIAQICVRYMNFRKTCEVQIKDINMCYDKQAVIDAVGMGILFIENGYFDAKEKMTLSESKEAIDRMLNIDKTSHYEEGEYEFEFQDNVVILEGDNKIEDIEIIKQEVKDVSGTANSKSYSVTTLDFKNSATPKVSSTALPFYDLIKITISTVDYLKKSNIYKPGVILVQEDYSGYLDEDVFDLTVVTKDLGLYTPIAIKITRVDQIGDGRNVFVYGLKAVADEIIKDNDGNDEGINTKGTNIKKVPDREIPDGINFDVENGYLVASFKHEFKMDDPIYKKQTWRNPSFSPSMTVTASIGNFQLDTQNIEKMILGKPSEAHVKLSYDTNFSTKLEGGGLRISPANNGNGGLKYSPEKGFSGDLLANVKTSRLTGATAGGSDKIKLAQINFQIGYGFSINMNVYLQIKFDGSIEFILEKTHTAEMKIEKTRSGEYDVDFNTYTTEEKSIELNANADISIELTPHIDFFSINIIDATGNFGVDIYAQAAIYSVKHNQLSTGMCATQTELDDYSNEEFGYCIGAQMEFYIAYKFLTENSLIGNLVINVLGMQTPSDRFPIASIGCHFEDGGFVDECTRGMDDSEIENMKNEDSESGNIGTYKVIIGLYASTYMDLNDVPTENTKLKEYEKNLTVRSRNEDIVKTTYDKKNGWIIFEGNGEGSTEIVITGHKKKGNFWQWLTGNRTTVYIEEVVSVTVVSNNVELTFSPNSYFKKVSV